MKLLKRKDKKMICNTCSGAHTPEYKPVPIRLQNEQQSKRIKTIVGYCLQSNKFDMEVNAAICNGWTLDKVKLIASESTEMLFALLHRYEK